MFKKVAFVALKMEYFILIYNWSVFIPNYSPHRSYTSNKTNRYFLLFAQWKSSILDQQLYNLTNLLQKFFAFASTSS